MSDDFAPDLPPDLPLDPDAPAPGDSLPANPALRAEVAELITAAQDGTATEEQLRRLGELLADPTARQYYVRHVLVSVLLTEGSPGAAARAPLNPGAVSPAGAISPQEPAADSSVDRTWNLSPSAAPAPPRGGGRRAAQARRRRWSAAAALLLAAGLAAVAALVARRPPPTIATGPGPTSVPTLAPGPAPAPKPAVLAAALDARWEGRTPQPIPPAPGATTAPAQPLPAGELHLAAGLARIDFANGARVVVEGPADFRADPADPATPAGRVDLKRGRLTAFVPAAAHGFEVVTPTATIIDLGTEFGVTAGADGATDTEVFAGRVSVTAQSAPAAPGGSAGAPVQVTAGSGLRVGPGGQTGPPPPPRTPLVRPGDFDRLSAAADPDAGPLQRWQAWSEKLRRDPDLIAYYTFDPPAQPAGTTGATDSPADRLPNRSAAGSALDGKLGGDDPAARPAWVEGRWPGKGALAFRSGTPQHVALPDAPAFNFSHGPDPAAPFTLAAWVKASAKQSSETAIFSRGPTHAEQYALDVYRGKFRAFVRRVGSFTISGAEATSNISPDGGWHHLACVYDPAQRAVTLYVDGARAAVTGTAPTLVDAGGPVSIGSRPFLGSAFNATLDGTIDEVALLARPLAADEVHRMYEAGKP